MTVAHRFESDNGVVEGGDSPRSNPEDPETRIYTYRPVLDDAPFRAFATTADYRRWCEENLPDWLGYGRL